MATYEEAEETLIVVNGAWGERPQAFVVEEDLFTENPRRKKKPEIVLPLGDYEFLRVRTALVRDADFDRFEAPRVTSSETAFDILKEATNVPQELVFSILMDTKNTALGIHEVHRGSVGASVVSPVSVFQAAVVANASGIIIAHNHPTGNPEPGAEDMELKLFLQEAARFLDIRFLDFLIIGQGEYVSLADRGLL